MYNAGGGKSGEVFEVPLDLFILRALEKKKKRGEKRKKRGSGLTLIGVRKKKKKKLRDWRSSTPISKPEMLTCGDFGGKKKKKKKGRNAPKTRPCLSGAPMRGEHHLAKAHLVSRLYPHLLDLSQTI